MAYKNKKNKSMQQQEMIFQSMNTKKSAVPEKEHTTKVFSPMELVNFCHAVYCSEMGTKESEYEMDWEDFLDEDTADLYDELNTAEQKKFDQAVAGVLSKLKAQFENLPVNVDSKESFERLEAKKQELSGEVASMMSEYVK